MVQSSQCLRCHHVSIAPYLGIEIIPSPWFLKEKCILSTLLSSQFAYVDALNMNVKSCPKSTPRCLMLASELPRQCGGMLCLCPILHLMCVWSHPILSYLILTRQQNPDDILDKTISNIISSPSLDIPCMRNSGPIYILSEDGTNTSLSHYVSQVHLISLNGYPTGPIHGIRWDNNFKRWDISWDKVHPRVSCLVLDVYRCRDVHMLDSD